MLSTTWYRDSNGGNTTVNGVSASSVVTDYNSANQGGTTDQYLVNWGIGAAALENFSGKTQLGNWGKLYFENSATSRVFTGNQYVKTLGLAKTGKALGIVGAGVGIGVGIYKVANHQESLGKFGADGIATGIGFTGRYKWCLYRKYVIYSCFWSLSI